MRQVLWKGKVRVLRKHSTGAPNFGKSWIPGRSKVSAETWELTQVGLVKWKEDDIWCQWDCLMLHFFVSTSSLHDCFLRTWSLSCLSLCLQCLLTRVEAHDDINAYMYTTYFSKAFILLINLILITILWCNQNYKHFFQWINRGTEWINK